MKTQLATFSYPRSQTVPDGLNAPIPVIYNGEVPLNQQGGPVCALSGGINGKRQNPSQDNCYLDPEEVSIDNLGPTTTTALSLSTAPTTTSTVAVLTSTSTPVVTLSPSSTSSSATSTSSKPPEPSVIRGKTKCDNGKNGNLQINADDAQAAMKTLCSVQQGYSFDDTLEPNIYTQRLPAGASGHFIEFDFGTVMTEDTSVDAQAGCQLKNSYPRILRQVECMPAWIAFLDDLQANGCK